MRRFLRILLAAGPAMKAVALVAAATVLGAAAGQAAEPWVGTWAASTHWCPPGQRGGAAPITITPQGHESAGNQCLYTSIVQEAEATWRVEADCLAPSGIPYRERFIFEMFGEHLAITYPDRGGVQVLQMPCP